MVEENLILCSKLIEKAKENLILSSREKRELIFDKICRRKTSAVDS